MNKKKSALSKLGSQEFIVFLVVIALFIFFSLLSRDFRKYTTVLSIMDYSYYIILMAIGVTFPLITGGVDLSIGTGLICYSLAGGYLIVHCGWPTWAGMLVSVAFGLVIGILNGCLVSLMNLPPFLATLCTCMITRGLGSLCSSGYGISWPTVGTDGSWFRSIFKYTIETENGPLKLPLGIVWMIILVLIMGFVLKHTKIGRYTIAAATAPVRIGEVNQEATSESITSRGLGFIDKFAELATADGKKVAVIGNEYYVNNCKDAGDEATADIIIEVAVPAQTTVELCATAAATILSKEDTIGMFGSNQVSAEGILSANENLDVLGIVPGEDILAAGFDAGSVIKAAINNDVMFGAVTQSPLAMGETTVEVLYKIANGETVEDVPTEGYWYNKDNMEDDSIAPNLYD